MIYFPQYKHEGTGRIPFYPKSILRIIDGKTLYYPCSGLDLLPPIRLFAPYITTFWFVDIAYFSGRILLNPRCSSDSIARYINILEKEPEYTMVELCTREDYYWQADDTLRKKRESDPYWIDPYVRTEKYLHKPSGRIITINLRRGYGYSGFIKENLGELGIFFFRGDSGGEGGSGATWLHSHMDLICINSLKADCSLQMGLQSGEAVRGNTAFCARRSIMNLKN